MSDLQGIIKANWERVNEAIQKTASAAGVTPPKVVVVTKKQPVEVIKAVVDAGADLLGENYPEEAVQKMGALLNLPVQWHMIGHIQSRKSALIAENFGMVHSVDRIKVASKLSEVCVQNGRVLPILLECNVSGEGSKSGYPAWSDDQLDGFYSEILNIQKLPGLQIRGLMTMPPYDEDAETCRPYFQRLRWLKDQIEHQLGLDINELSMGTSFDHLVAIQEGATFVRIGTAITGERKY